MHTNTTRQARVRTMRSFGNPIRSLPSRMQVIDQASSKKVAVEAMLSSRSKNYADIITPWVFLAWSWPINSAAEWPNACAPVAEHEASTGLTAVIRLHQGQATQREKCRSQDTHHIIRKLTDKQNNINSCTKVPLFHFGLRLS